MEDRIQLVNQSPLNPEGEYILYWMQAAQRVEHNYALGYAIELANKWAKPLEVVFVLTSYPEANIRHYWFMWEGLRETAVNLKNLGIPFTVFQGSPGETLEALGKKASVLITEKAYLHTPRIWRKSLSGLLKCQMIEVETEVVVPVETVSKKEEYAAATIRKKITSQWHRYLRDYALPNYVPPKNNDSHYHFPNPAPPIVNILPESTLISTPEDLAKALRLINEPGISTSFQGGYSKASEHLDIFLETKLQDFADKRSDPSREIQSNLSPYLHFGQISSVEIALRARDYWNKEVLGMNRGFIPQDQAIPQEPLEAFLEELIVRRELAFNFTYYNPVYDTYECLPQWARDSLGEHSQDPRTWNYSLEDLETAKTHDPYWNAAQREMVKTGKMAGYMRMYWGKKILEWTKTPQEAFIRTLYLNNKYFLDGRDPNSFAGVAWCFGKHDRPWNKREIFGSVRYMNDKGLERKFKIKEYAARWNQEDLFSS